MAGSDLGLGCITRLPNSCPPAYAKGGPCSRAATRLTLNRHRLRGYTNDFSDPQKSASGKLTMTVEAVCTYLDGIRCPGRQTVDRVRDRRRIGVQIRLEGIEIDPQIREIRITGQTLNKA